MKKQIILTEFTLEELAEVVAQKVYSNLENLDRQKKQKQPNEKVQLEMIQDLDRSNLVDRRGAAAIFEF